MNQQTLPVALDDRISITRPVHRYFPGWTMLGIAAAAQYLSAPGQSYSVAVFKDPMRTGLGLSETQFSGAYAFATMLSACLVPWVGRQLDRFGARIVLPLIAAGLGISCFFMSLVQSLPGLYIGFTFVRSLGQGALTLASIWLVGEWFERRRGMATALAGLGGGLSVMTVPLCTHWVITRFGWEAAWTVMAAVVAGLLVVPGILFIRDRPEELGLFPDGIEPDRDDADEAADDGAYDPAAAALAKMTAESWTLAEVLRDPTFWKLLSVPATAALVGTGLIFHQVGLLGSRGVPAAWALGLLSVQALFATTMSFPAGWATDRFPSRYILFFAMIVLSAANLLALTLPVVWLIVLYSLLLGLQGSIFRSTAAVVWINYYGRLHQGAVRGMAWSAMILASAIGPLPVAVSIDYWKSYDPALYLFIVLPLLAAAAVWTAYPPQRKG